MHLVNVNFNHLITYTLAFVMQNMEKRPLNIDSTPPLPQSNRGKSNQRNWAIKMHLLVKTRNLKL